MTKRSKEFKGILFAFLLLALGLSAKQQETLLRLSGPYLGQKPPGMTPEIFAPGVISTADHEYGIAFSKDLREIFLKRASGGKGKDIVYTRRNTIWQGPEDVAFDPAGTYGQLQVTSDGEHLLANRITTDKDGNSVSTIVLFVRKNGVWTNPQPIGAGMRATSTDSGTIYVTHIPDPQKRFGLIGRYQLRDGKYEGPEVLDEAVNHGNFSSAHPFIAPDESYLIFDSRREEDKRDGLYISFREDGRSWSPAASLSKALQTGADARDWYATVSPDGQYLFFSSSSEGSPSDIYWVSAKILEGLRPKK